MNNKGRLKQTWYGKYIYMIPILFLILYGVQILYITKSTLSPYSAAEHNKKICLVQLNSYYSGVIHEIKKINGSKKRRVILRDGSIRYPYALYHQLHLLSQGDSIIKKAGSFAYTVFPKMGFQDSFILDKYATFSCDFKNDNSR